jgi:hypothetical protein
LGGGGKEKFVLSCVRTGHVAGVFVQIPRDLAGKSVRAALWFESAGVAIQFAGAIESCALGCDAASGNGVGASELDKLFARRARVTVAFGVEGKVGAGERAVGSVGLVEDRDVRGNVFLFDQPSGEVAESDNELTIRLKIGAAPVSIFSRRSSKETVSPFIT